MIGVKDRKTILSQCCSSCYHRCCYSTELRAEPGGTTATVYTDGNKSYRGLPNHQAVQHSVGEYVREVAHTNGIESFWAMLKRAHKGVYHKMSFKHLHRYINRRNVREQDTIKQMAALAAGMVGKRLRYRT